jgi:acyl-CoA reductase-like NAD-dependent aldehyde dehydrogenase
MFARATFTITITRTARALIPQSRTVMTAAAATAADAIGRLDKAKWAATSAEDRLALLKQIQLNLRVAQYELSAAEASMKNARLDKPEIELYTPALTTITTVIPMANNISGAIALYESLISTGTPLEPGSITKVHNTDPTIVDSDLYDIVVAPRTWKETIFYGSRQDRIRVGGTPTRVGPLQRPTQVVGILGAGNYNAPVEIIKAIFFNNCVVAFKPHPLNDTLVSLLAQILSPLIDGCCLSFCASDQGPALTKDTRVDLIYFTGGRPTAETIMSTTQTPLICEAGGVNPTLLVPSDRPWTASELAHHALQIVSMGKANGGHICARPQLVVTCRQWSQREEFLKAMETAIKDTSFATGSYYPNTSKVMDEFAAKYPTAKRIQPEHGKYGKSSDVLWIVGDSEDGYACQTEAFCQVFSEVALDTPPNATEFLASATNFCNHKVNGSLVAAIILDETTRKNHTQALDQAVTDLQFGTIGINLMAAHAFSSEYLSWGEYTVLGNGGRDFGNLFGYQNVNKCILEDIFVSPAQLKFVNKAALTNVLTALSEYSVWNSWYNLGKMLYAAIKGQILGRRKDW